MIPKRVAYVLNIFPKISETFISGELAELRRRNIELRILSLLPPRHEPRHEIVNRAGLDKLTEYDVPKFASVLRSFQPELIHAHFAREATEKARALSELTGIPFTFTAHGYDIHRKPPPDFRERASAASAVVTVSKVNRDYIEKVFGVPSEHIHVIPCGVDLNRFSPARDSLPDATTPLILCVARHVAVKNLGLLLDACAELQQRDVPFRCVMIGDGPLHDELKAKRTKLNLDKNVEMRGAADQDEVLGWWQQASVGVLTSEHEGMPVSLMEAAACGVPVLATRVGGIPEVVDDGVTGILSPAGDASAFAIALEKLLSDSALCARMGAAARVRALEKFSVVKQADSLLGVWARILSTNAANAPVPNVDHGSHDKSAPDDPRVRDEFVARADQELPGLAAALNFETAWSAFKRRLPLVTGPGGKLRLKAIRVMRHKPGRRAVVEYDVKLRRPGVQDEKLTLIGKTRVRRSGNESQRLQEAIWNAGFQADSTDGFSVPEPLGVIADFQMWFQRKVEGVTAEEIFSKSSKPERIRLAHRVAEAIHKLHRSNVPTDKRHTMEDELRILQGCFEKVTAAKPAWKERIANVQLACEKLATTISSPVTCGIHRDFYPAQVIVHGERLWLIDFDLYCEGDPGLDVGNFIGHITEQSMRQTGREDTFRDVERTLEDRFAELAGEGVRKSVCVYTTLTLARHIFLSTRLPGRAHLTESLLELCERRLSLTPIHCA